MNLPGTMLKHTYKLPKKLSLKGALRFAKSLLASNIALAIIAVPGGSSTNFMSQPQDGLMIPETNLAITFNIPNKEDQIVQIPTDYTYMSQRYHVYHPGIDLVAKYGTPIKPIKIGIVVESGYTNSGYGKMVMIDHENGLRSLYAHLSKIEVKKGDKVGLDTEIGLIGTTGQSTGSHLHLEIEQDGKAIDPLTILPPITTGGLTLSLR